VSNDDFIVFIPPNRYSFGIRYDLPESGEGFFAETTVQYVARQSRTPRIITPTEFRVAIEDGIDPLQGSVKSFDFMPPPEGYLLATASLGFGFTAHEVKYRFQFSADNLLNTSYRDYTNRFRYYADEIGRNFKLLVKLTF
jgi:iron complex outermembrane receptor protein